MPDPDYPNSILRKHSRYWPESVADLDVRYRDATLALECEVAATQRTYRTTGRPKPTPDRDTIARQLNRRMLAGELTPHEVAAKLNALDRRHRASRPAPAPGTAAAAIPLTDLRTLHPVPKPAPPKRLSDEPYLTAAERRQNRVGGVVGTLLITLGAGLAGVAIAVGSGADIILGALAALLGLPWLRGLHDA